MKPSVVEVRPVVQALYRRSGVGCCWHIVLDDGNVDDGAVRWCVAQVRDSGCPGLECRQLAELLPQMSRTQRRKLGSKADA